ILLRLLKKKYFIVLEGAFPQRLKFLLTEYTDTLIPELVNIPKGNDLKVHLPENFNAESIIILDTCGNDRLGEFSKYFTGSKTILNIDHHTGKRKFSGPYDLIDDTAGATGEIIYNFLKTNRIPFKKEIANLIYISIITDTRNFTQSNTTSQSHIIASECLKKGIEPEKTSFYFQELPAKALQIYGNVISRLKLHFNKKLAYSYITKDELNKCPNSDTDGLIEMLRDVEGVKAAFLFKELGKRDIKVSMRGKEKFDVHKIAKQFNGGGHKQAAGFNLEKSLDGSIKFLLKELKKYF
ncbi:MAG: hypothetical protein KKH98_09970, partial [Spirochaetes bacterium]|nr:hypothetical protein [Spirochaetota bacterium]